jgi:hypothetical protein
VKTEQPEHWRARIEKLLRTVPLDHILNRDEEASWPLWPRRILTWPEINFDHPHALIRGDGKENLTALVTITASGDRFPLFFLVRGRTGRVERSQIGAVTPHWVSHKDAKMAAIR